MAKVSGLIANGIIGNADPKVVAAMPQMSNKPISQRKATPSAESQTDTESLEGCTTLLPETVRTIPLAHIRRSPYQVRSMGDDAYINSLMESISDSGVISPIVVRPLPVDVKGSNFELFEFVAGEHRAEACKRLGQTTIKAIVREMADKEAAVALATDNAVRKNLDDFDRYQHARMLRQNGFCRTDSEVAVTLGMSKSHVSMLGSFSVFPEDAQAVLRSNPGLLGAAYAYQLRDLANTHPELITQALEAVAHGKLKQTGIRTWILSHTRSHISTLNKTTVKLNRPGLPPVSLIFGENEAWIRCDGLDTAQLQQLIEANMDRLLMKES